MIKATRNQLANTTNPYQTTTKKVLCVCSAGLLRSPTLANVLHKELGYNTRACGSVESFALIPLSEALIHWADEIVFVDEDCKTYVDIETREEISLSRAKEVTLDIPDEYSFGSEVLEKELLRQYLLTQGG